jgi:hypothetical protein
MTEAEWAAGADHAAMVRFAVGRDAATVAQLRRFAEHCEDLTFRATAPAYRMSLYRTGTPAWDDERHRPPVAGEDWEPTSPRLDSLAADEVVAADFAARRRAEVPAAGGVRRAIDQLLGRAARAAGGRATAERRAAAADEAAGAARRRLEDHRSAAVRADRGAREVLPPHLAAVRLAVVRDVFGDPFRRPVAVAPGWRTPTVRAVAAAADEEAQRWRDERDWNKAYGRAMESVLKPPHTGPELFDRLRQDDYEDVPTPLDTVRLGVLADALEEAGCDAADLLAHLRAPGPHYRGCWAVAAVMGELGE